MEKVSVYGACRDEQRAWFLENTKFGLAVVLGEEIEDDGRSEGDGCYDGVICRTIFMCLPLTLIKEIEDHYSLPRPVPAVRMRTHCGRVLVYEAMVCSRVR
jgi:uncharacterized membrane protein YkvI